MMTEKFSLKWHDFQSNVSTTFSQLRLKSHFQDVTLVSDDHKQISAHRLVLSACSGYFNEILSQNSHSHPLLCMDGINFVEMNNVLDYIYNGELQIYQDDLDRFLQIAQKLQLKGLLSSDYNPKVEESKELTTFKTETEDNKSFLNNETKKIVSMNSEDFQSIEELDSHIENQILRTEDGLGYKCLICDYISKKKGHIKEHLECHIKGLAFDCDLCGNTLSSRVSLRTHKNWHKKIALKNKSLIGL